MTIADTPEIISELVDVPDPHLSTMGVKGLGEGGCIGAPAAIINAINDALTPFNVAIDEIPATPQRIRAALRAAEVSQ